MDDDKQPLRSVHDAVLLPGPAAAAGGAALIGSFDEDYLTQADRAEAIKIARQVLPVTVNGYDGADLVGHYAQDLLSIAVWIASGDADAALRHQGGAEVRYE